MWGTACTPEGSSPPDGEYGIVELTVLSGEVVDAGVPGATARALLNLQVDDEGVWSGEITFIDGGLIALNDPEGWTGPLVLDGGCEGDQCSFTYGDPDAPDQSTGGVEEEIALELSVFLDKTSAAGSLREVHRVGGYAVSEAELSLEGYLSGPSAFEPGEYPVTVLRNGECGAWNQGSTTLVIDFNETGRGTLTDTEGLLGDEVTPTVLEGTTSGQHFIAFVAGAQVTGEPESGTECEDRSAFWADLVVEEDRLTGSISYRKVFGDGGGEFACEEEPLDCTAVFVVDSPVQ